MEEGNTTKHTRWKQSTAALLSSVSHASCQPYNIPVVPDELRKWNENAYLPKVVSIGPRYKGRSDVLPMEEIKFRCITSLLCRTGVSIWNQEEEPLQQCMEAVLELDAEVRTSYADEIKLDRYDLANIMVFDGIFLLELLISGSALDSTIPARKSSPGEEVKKMEHVLSDLMLLENQIPTLVLETLFGKLFSGLDMPRASLIQSLALSLFGFSVGLGLNSSSYFKAFQFVDIALLTHTLKLNGRKQRRQRRTEEEKGRVLHHQPILKLAEEEEKKL